MHRDVFPEWSPGPSHPRPIESQVDVWRIGLALPNHPTADPTAHRTLARAATRDVLARYLERPAETLVLSVQPGGKPYLDLPLEFNLSHCTDTALLAVTAATEVGVDIERLRAIDDPLRLARRALTAAEVAQISAAPADRQLALFLDLAYRAGQSGVQEWLSFYWKSPQPAGGVSPEHDIFIQQTKLKNTLREWMGEPAVTHSEAG